LPRRFPECGLAPAINDGFHSGDGSHEPSVVEPYVAALRRYLAEVPEPVNLVVPGCGDFNVGRRLIDVANQTVACDIVPDLIARNRADSSTLA
jgi:hypothetical protein